jgi:hypothetical protein
MQPLDSSIGASDAAPAGLAWPAEQLQQHQIFQPTEELQQQQQQRLQDVLAAAADNAEAEAEADADNSTTAEEAVAAGPRELDKSLFVDGMRVSATKAASTGLYAQAAGKQGVCELGGWSGMKAALLHECEQQSH